MFVLCVQILSSAHDRNADKHVYITIVMFAEAEVDLTYCPNYEHILFFFYTYALDPFRQLTDVLNRYTYFTLHVLKFVSKITTREKNKNNFRN